MFFSCFFHDFDFKSKFILNNIAFYLFQNLRNAYIVALRCSLSNLWDKPRNLRYFPQNHAQKRVALPQAPQLVSSSLCRKRWKVSNGSQALFFYFRAVFCTKNHNMQARKQIAL